MRTLYSIIHFFSSRSIRSFVHFSLSPRLLLIPFQFDWMCVFVRRLIFGIHQFSRGFYSFSFVSFCCFFILICIFIVCYFFLSLPISLSLSLSYPVLSEFCVLCSLACTHNFCSSPCYCWKFGFYCNISYFGWENKNFGKNESKWLLLPILNLNENALEVVRTKCLQTEKKLCSEGDGVCEWVSECVC